MHSDLGYSLGCMRPWLRHRLLSLPVFLTLRGNRPGKLWLTQAHAYTGTQVKLKHLFKSKFGCLSSFFRSHDCLEGFDCSVMPGVVTQGSNRRFGMTGERRNSARERGKKPRVCGLACFVSRRPATFSASLLSCFSPLEPRAVPGTRSLGSGESGCGYTSQAQPGEHIPLSVNLSSEYPLSPFEGYLNRTLSLRISEIWFSWWELAFVRAVVECCLEWNLPITSEPVGLHQAKGLGVTCLVGCCYTVNEWSALDDATHTAM